jgi:hypothetical protein
MPTTPAPDDELLAETRRIAKGGGPYSLPIAC